MDSEDATAWARERERTQQEWLEQVYAEGIAVIEVAEVDAARIRADAEREAGRARREAEEVAAHLRADAEAYASRVRTEAIHRIDRMRQAAEEQAGQAADAVVTAARVQAEEVVTAAQAQADTLVTAAQVQADSETTRRSRDAAMLLIETELLIARRHEDAEREAERLRQQVAGRAQAAWEEALGAVEALRTEAGLMRGQLARLMNEAANLVPSLDAVSKGLRLVGGEVPRVADVVQATAEAEGRGHGAEPSEPATETEVEVGAEAEVGAKAEAETPARRARPLGRLLPGV